MKKVTQGDKKKMVWLDMQHFPQMKIAQRIGISQARVYHYIRWMKDSGEYDSFKHELQGSEPVTFDDERPAPEPEPPKGMPMPECVVPAVPIEEVTQTIVMTEEHTAEIPDAVISAVESKVADLRKEIQRNAEQAASLLQHNDNYIKRIEILEKWLAEVRDA